MHSMFDPLSSSLLEVEQDRETGQGLHEMMHRQLLRRTNREWSQLDTERQRIGDALQVTTPPPAALFRF